MTISEIVRAAAREHLTYGEYVKRYCPPKPPEPPQRPTRTCVCCGRDISTRRPPAKYCLTCADRAYRERHQATNRRYKEKRKESEVNTG